MEHLTRVRDEFTRQAETFDAYAPQAGGDLLSRFARALSDAAGGVLLDLACGPGVLAAGLAPGAKRVVAFDATPAMLEKAQRRCAAAGVANVEFRQGDAAALPFEDGAFDVTIASLSLMFADDPVMAVREFGRVTVPDGRVAIAIWGRPEACDMRHLFRAVKDTFPPPPPGKGPFALTGEGELRSLVQSAGLRVLSESEVEAPFFYDSFDALWEAQSAAGPFQGALRTVGADVLRPALREAARPFQRADGSIRLDNRFRYVVAMPLQGSAAV